MQLAAGVRHEEIVAPVAGEVACGDPHARVRVVDRELPAVLDEPEAEAVLRGQVEVEPVGVEVVRHEQVGTAVAVHVGERRAEPMVETVRLQPGGAPDLTEPRVPAARADVEVEEVAHRRRGSRGSRMPTRAAGG